VDVVSALAPPLVVAVAFVLAVRAVVRHSRREEHAERDTGGDEK
jgi:hypothetical protein